MENKICKRCNIQKVINEFGVRIKNKDGYKTNCKQCEHEKYSIWYEKNRYKKSEMNKEYYINNKEKLNKNNKEYREINRERINERTRNRYKNDVIYKLSQVIRCGLRSGLKRKKYVKENKTQMILGSSFEEFKIYLESKFEPWMTWDNYGLYNGNFEYGWDIDHIEPIDIADTEEKVIKLFHYTNLRPLCSKINRDIKKNN